MSLKNIEKEELIKICKEKSEKINHQIDELKKLQKELNIKDELILNLKKELEKNTKNNKENEINNYYLFRTIFNILFNVVRKLITTDAFISTINKTEINRNFQIVERELFKGLVNGLIEETNYKITEKEIIKTWAKLGLLYTDKNDRYYFPYNHRGEYLKIVRIKKELIFLVKEDILHD